MKKFLTFLTVAGLTVTSFGYAQTQEAGILTNTDLNKISKKHSTDKASRKAWKKFDKFLTGVLAVTTGTALISKITPAGEYTFKVPVFNGFKTYKKENGFNCLGLCRGDFDHNQVLTLKYPTFISEFRSIDYNETGKIKFHGDTLELVKPQLFKVSLAATAVAAALKLGVKIKRATL